MVANNTPRASRGLSLVEILVGMVIGLIATIVIFQVFATSEAYKRTTTAGGDAQSEGAIALYTLERDIRQAGYGINDVALMGCLTGMWDEEAPEGQELKNFRMVPVQITQGVGGTPDTIAVMYGNGDGRPSPANLIDDPNESSTVFKVNNRYGFNQGDLIIAAEAGLNCTLRQVSGVPGTPGQTDNVIHNSGEGMRYNRASGMPNNPPGFRVNYTTSAKIFNIGSQPVLNIYSIQSNRLMLQEVFGNDTSARPIFENIIQMQAQYGMDNDNNGTVDAYVESDPVNQADWARIVAIRLTLIARSTQYEKPQEEPDGDLVYVSNEAIPYWPNTGSSGAYTPTGEARNYRYKVFRTTVPIRNMIWRH